MYVIETQRAAYNPYFRNSTLYRPEGRVVRLVRASTAKLVVHNYRDVASSGELLNWAEVVVCSSWSTMDADKRVGAG